MSSVICPKCKLYELQPDNSIGTPRGTLACICGHVQYKGSVKPIKGNHGAQSRENVSQRVYEMVKKECTHEHIMESFPEMKRATITTHISNAHKRLRGEEAGNV